MKLNFERCIFHVIPKLCSSTMGFMHLSAIVWSQATSTFLFVDINKLIISQV